MPRASAQRYNGLAMTLHWVIALLIITNIGLAWYFNTLQGAAKGAPIMWHKSIGITVLLLSVLRLAWRLVARPPPLPATARTWERVASGVVYVGFYVIMIGMPLTGWAMSSANPARPIILYGSIHWPQIGAISHLPADQAKAVGKSFNQLHGLGAKLAYALIVLHVAAALRHWLLLRDGVMGRMVPFLRAPAR